MRTQLALKNSYWGIISQLILLLVSFISRKVFIDTLGPSYLGLNGLLSNVISLLSLAELGISSAIIYNLYKPLADNNQKEITKLMNFYKTSYRWIAVIIAILGLIIFPFINLIINDSEFTLSYIRIIFLLFLFESVSTYFFSYKRSIIFADQKNYIIVICDTIFRLIITLVNIIILINTHSFILYLLSSISFRLLNNLLIAKIADKNYPYINNKDRLDKDKRKIVLDNIKNIMINKLSWTVTSATDNIIISAFVNLTTVGLMSNYNMVVLSVQNLILQFLKSIQASIGNLLVNTPKDHIYLVLNRLTFFSFMLASFCGVSLFVLLNPFISIWLGEEYTLSKMIVAVLVINFYLIISRSPLWQMVGVSGLFRKEKNIALLGTVINLILSLLLVKIFGLLGVLIGTLISLIIQFILKVPLFFNEFLGIKYYKYFRDSIIFIILFLFEAFLTFYISNVLTFDSSYRSFILKVLLCLIIPNIVNLSLFKNTNEFRYYKRIIGSKLNYKKFNKMV